MTKGPRPLGFSRKNPTEREEQSLNVMTGNRIKKYKRRG